MEIHAFTRLELRALDKIERNLSTRKPEIMNDIGVYVVSSVVQNFEAGGRPDKWPPNAASTLKQKPGNMVLVHLGLLKAGMMHWIEGDSVFVGSGGPASVYSRIQQKGGETGRNHATTLPPRPYVVLQVADRTFIISLMREEVLYGG